jgi:hypothetical protein
LELWRQRSNRAAASASKVSSSFSIRSEQER